MTRRAFHALLVCVVVWAFNKLGTFQAVVILFYFIYFELNLVFNGATNKTVSFYEVQYAVFQVKNNGFFYTTKITITYTLNGNSQTLTEFCLPALTQSVKVPAGAINMQISANAVLGEKIFSDSIPNPQWKCFEVGGTAFNTNWKTVPC